MTFLPIVTRELRVASRRRGTYWSRCVTGVLALIAGFIVYLINFNSAPADISQALFAVLSIGAFIYCLFAGVRSTAHCLSEEKHEGTLGLLFLTDLKGYDVVGGKLVATSLNAFYGLLAILPVMAIPLLMGGVTNGEFWRMALVLANTFFFSLAAGMFMSALSQSPRRAMAGTFLFLLGSSLGLLLAGGLIPFIYESTELRHICYLLNPGYSATLVDDTVFKTEAENFWWSAGIIHALAWLLLALASIIVPRSWQDRASGAAGGRWHDRWRQWSFGANAERALFRRRLLDANAFFWLTARARLKPVFVWATFGILACFWSWGAIDNGHSWEDPSIYFVTSIILNTMLKLWITSEAGRRLGEDRKLGSLELILSTPLSVRDIIRGQILALRRQFLGPTLAVMGIEFAFLLASLNTLGGNGASDAPWLVGCWAAGNVMLVADMLALSVVAMWVGLSTRNPNRTSGIVVTRVLVLPLAVSFLILVSFGIVDTVIGANFNPDWKYFVALWFLPGIFADILFGMRAWRRLHSEFREVAAQRFAPRVSLWQRIFGSRSGVPHAGT